MPRFAVSSTPTHATKEEISSVLHDIQVALSPSPEPNIQDIFGPIHAPRSSLACMALHLTAGTLTAGTQTQKECLLGMYLGSSGLTLRSPQPFHS